MLLLLAVLGLIYFQARKASTWQWLAPQRQAASTATQNPRPASKLSQETIQPGPTDLDERDLKETRDKFAVVVDQAPQTLQEMPAYWQCMRWVLAQPFTELQARAEKSVTMSKLWDQPEVFRAKIVSLMLHVRRIEKHPAPQNSAQLSHVYELWGWTEDSKSLPYCLVVPELPEGMTPGLEIDHDVLFAGYFLKWLRYTPGVGPQRSSPLLIGRVQSAGNAARVFRPRPKADAKLQWIIGGVVLLMAGGVVWMNFSGSSRRPLATTTPQNEDQTMAFLDQAFTETPQGNEDQTSDSEPPSTAP